MSEDPLRPDRIVTASRFGDVALNNQTQFALRAVDDDQWFLDGVFNDRTLGLSDSTRFPFVGTRWKLIELAGGAWQLACQGDTAFSLFTLDGGLLLGRPAGEGQPPRSMQWLLFRLHDTLLLRSLDGYWLGRRAGRPVAEHVDDLADPAFHWLPVSYR